MIPPYSFSTDCPSPLCLSQIERQLDLYLSRVEAVLGKDWGTHVDGQQLRSDGESFRVKLNPQPVFEEWKKQVRD